MRYVQVLDTKRNYTTVPVPWQAHLDLIQQQGEFWEWLMEHPGGDFSIGTRNIFIYDDRDAAVYLLRWS